MDLQVPRSRPLAALLHNYSDVEPPAELRERLLRRYGVRRALRPAAAALAVVVAVAAAWAILPLGTASDEVARWQARSMELEADWRRTADRQWLRQDARAQTLLGTLQQLDRQLAHLHAQESADREAMAQLWRARVDVMAALVDSSRQGGVAVRI
jgi:hypothetical protein